MLVLGSCCFLVLCRFLLFTLKEALVSSLPQRTRRQSAPVDGDPEAIEEMMVVKEDEDPVMIFTRYKEKMEKFLKVTQDRGPIFIGSSPFLITQLKSLAKFSI